MKATALEVLSEPLSLLTLLAALTISVLAPAFHYHQFGEATRMARDAGCSALLVCGGILAVFGTIRAFRREIESGTMAMALAHPVSRTGFFAAKALGSLVAYLVFVTIVFGTMTVIFEGAAIGGVVARQTGDVARLYGPCLAIGLAVMLVPLTLAAILNRFGRFRFVLTVFALAFGGAVIAGTVIAVLSRGYVLRLVPVSILLMMPAGVLLTAAAAFAVRFKANVAASLTGLVLVVILPAVGNYCLSDALTGGGVVPWSYVGLAALAAMPVLVGFMLLGVRFISKIDIQ